MNGTSGIKEASDSEHTASDPNVMRSISFKEAQYIAYLARASLDFWFWTEKWLNGCIYSPRVVFDGKWCSNIEKMGEISALDVERIPEDLQRIPGANYSIQSPWRITSRFLYFFF